MAIIRRKRFLIVGLWCAILATAGSGSQPPSLGAGFERAQPAEIFADATTAAGLEFNHFNGATGELQLPEITGSGGGLFDYDGDGDLDLYAVQGAPLFPAKPSDPRPSDRLFRNDLEILPDGRRIVRFVDVTEQAGIRAEGYGMGVAAGDVDNDGDVDLYVTNLGSNQLLRNNGDGTFTDVTAESQADDPNWSTSASFFDYDRDGWLDLFVANYVRYSSDDFPKCYSPSSRRDYCGPAAHKPAPDRLFRNLGGAVFEDVTLRAGLSREFGAGLGVVSGDFNRDGWVDLYVANDGLPNQLWINRKNGTFVNEALLSGVALNRMGKAEAGMGVDAADFDGDGDEDLFVSHLNGETNTVYVNDGDGNFEDRSIETQLAAASFPYTGFGAGWVDYDNDGRLDVLVLNGEVRIIEKLAAQGHPYPLVQPNQLFHNLGDGRFVEVKGAELGVLADQEVSRGAAFGDVDNDGDRDLVIFNNNGPLRLLLNNVGNQSRWLGVKVVSKAGRDALGAVVTAAGPAGTLIRRVRTDGSYCSANDPRILLGLGGSKDALSVRVDWPGGVSEKFADLPTGAYHTLTEGRGQSIDPQQP